jgi:hypothetical protein
VSTEDDRLRENLKKIDDTTRHLNEMTEKARIDREKIEAQQAELLKKPSRSEDAGGLLAYVRRLFRRPPKR